MKKNDENAAVIQGDRQPHDAYQIAFPIDGLGGVHEDITKAAATKVGMPFSKKLEQGVEWPDIPSDKPERTSYPQFFENLNKPGTITYESHNGANQFWHSMAPREDGKTYTNGEVLNKIVNQAAAWFEQAKYHNEAGSDAALFYIGNLLHMVQDSYSPAHVVRNESGAVVSFQSYDQQDHGAHRRGESKQMVDIEGGFGPEQGRLQAWQEVPGAVAAYHASVKILELYKNGANSDALKAYLRQDVYHFENEQTQTKPAGEIDPRYAPRSTTRTAESNKNPIPSRQEAIAMLSADKPLLAVNYAGVSAALLNGHDHFSELSQGNRSALAAMIQQNTLNQSADIPWDNVIVSIDTHPPANTREYEISR